MVNHVHVQMIVSFSMRSYKILTPASVSAKGGVMDDPLPIGMGLRVPLPDDFVIVPYAAARS